MPSRAAGSMPSATMLAAASASSRPTMLRRTACCNSSSVGAEVFMFGSVEQDTGMRRFIEQHLERRDVGVPFDQRRHWPEARERLRVERPNCRRDARAVIVDAQRVPVAKFLYRVAGKMDLANGRRRQGGEISRSVPAVIAGAHVDVVDIAQNSAAGALHDASEEFPFRNRRM